MRGSSSSNGPKSCSTAPRDLKFGPAALPPGLSLVCRIVSCLVGEKFGAPDRWPGAPPRPAAVGHGTDRNTNLSHATQCHLPKAAARLDRRVGPCLQGSASSVSHVANVAAAWYEPRPMAGRHSPAMDGCIAAWGTAPGSQDTRTHTRPAGPRHARQPRLGLCAAARGPTAQAPHRQFAYQQACSPRSARFLAPGQSPSQASMS